MERADTPGHRPASRHGARATLLHTLTNGRPAERAMRPHRAAAGRPPAGSARRAGRRQAARTTSGDGYRNAATAANAGGVAPRSAALDAERALHVTARDFHRTDAAASRTRCCERMQQGRAARRGMAAAWPRKLFFQEPRAARHRRRLLRASRRPGTRSASAARPARAAMCAWASTDAIRGKRRRRRRARRPSAAENAVSDEPQIAPRGATAARPTCSASAAGCRCANTRERGGRLRHRRHRRGRRHARLPARRAGLLRRRVRCRPVLASARGIRLRRARASEALLDRRAHRATARIR